MTTGRASQISGGPSDRTRNIHLGKRGRLSLLIKYENFSERYCGYACSATKQDARRPRGKAAMARPRDDELANLRARVAQLESVIDAVLTALAPFHKPAPAPCPPDCGCPTSDSGEVDCVVRRREKQARRPYAVAGDLPLPHDAQEGQWSEAERLKMDSRFKQAMLKSRR